MNSIQIRQARLDDTQAISALFRSQVSVWQRLNASGQVEDVAYDALTLYERWQHGQAQQSSPWMSIETGAIFLNHLLRGFALPLVAEIDGAVQAYAEAYPGFEPAPFGAHLHVTHLLAPPGGELLVDALMRELTTRARSLGAQRLTVSISGYDAEAQHFYQRYGFALLTHARRYHLPAQMGQSFYKAADHRSTDPSQIDQWFMTIGRLENARQHWATHWPRLWEAIDEFATRPTYRLRFNAAGVESFVHCQQQLYQSRSAEFACWSPKPLTPQMLTALRDWAHRENFRTLVLTVPPETVPLLGAEAEATPYQRDILGVDV